ncbi:DUF4476 domain-containing protein [candidate division WOR-3 bacterium]|uniref:DUF4476 domain-containing protein n=1 Tax=candidate division WOR-3 bacterium TaxID=2052148 RepID=A0A9D5K809_UNCW3|nr:DUF4476 domain-containing protein [candidate division WOR-3 bacterium]MBD3363845.1 DUF4476 domain-containing protein [candidate division WOR-3 bacterium]
MIIQALALTALMLSGTDPSAISDNEKMFLREVTHLERAGDDLMELMMEVEDRSLRREITEHIDDIYEACERMRQIIVEDSIPEPIRAEDLERFLEELNNATFSDAKAAMISEFARSNWFTTEQAGKIIEEVPFGVDMVDAAVAMYPHLIDPENTYRLYEFITFDDDRELLREKLNELNQEPE